MMTTVDRPTVSHSFPMREVSPAGWARFVEKEEATPLQIAVDNFVQWNRVLAQCEKLWAEHVYNNQDFEPLDARQHRAMLHTVIGKGEELAVDFLVIQSSGDVKSYVSFLDDKLAELKKVLYEWHGPVTTASGIPSDFALGMNQIAGDKIVDLDVALTEKVA